MNRMEFMTQLAALLQDIPAEERRDAMQYYNDYFDDAGAENEQKVIEELESPQKVAEKIKADLGTVSPAPTPTPGKNDRTLKIILIILILLVGLPVVLPVALGVLAAAFGVAAGILGLFLGLVAASFAIAVAGILLVVAGAAILFPELAAGLALIGVGLILTVIGVIFLVGSIKLCAVAIPGIFRGVVWICRKPFQRKVVA